MEKIRVMIADDSMETRDNIRKLLSFEEYIEIVGEAANGEDAVFAVRDLRPDILLLDINMPGMDGIKACEEISLSVPETIIIIISVQGGPEYFRSAMLAGARSYLVKPFSASELVTAISETFQKEQIRRGQVTKKIGNEELSSKVICVFSTKGGVGKTTIASNIAVSIARSTRKKVALIDLDLQFGDVGIMLNVTVKNTISDLIKEISQLDANLMEEYLVTHFSGVKVLPAPIKPEYAEYITGSNVEKIINTLKERYNYIIIDTSASFHETVLTSLDLSDKILFVSTLDLPTIKNVKAGLDVLETLRYPKDKISIVLNKASEQFGIKYKDFENTLRYSISHYIPEDSQTVVTSANKGFPFVMTRTETKVAKAVIAIAEELTSSTKLAEPEKRIKTKLFG